MYLLDFYLLFLSYCVGPYFYLCILLFVCQLRFNFSLRTFGSQFLSNFKHFHVFSCIFSRLSTSYFLFILLLTFRIVLIYDLFSLYVQVLLLTRFAF